MNLILMEVPHWTTYAQSCAAIISVPGIVAAFIILFVKDKTQERKIAELGNIASQLTQMLNVSENRYRNSKKPHLETRLEQDAEQNKVQIFFRNTNRATSLKEYNAIVINDDVRPSRYAIADNNGEQTFSLDLTYTDELFIFAPIIEVILIYQTDEGYIFYQEIIVASRDIHERNFWHIPNSITLRENTSAYVLGHVDDNETNWIGVD
ncbi:MAG: hypothetical protein V4604_13695 [Bacteroidota bacterium]